MKKTRLFLFLVICMAIIISSVTGCSAKPQAVVDELLSALKRGDYDAAGQYMIVQDDSPMKNVIDEGSNEIFDRLFKNLEYSILSTSVENDEAVVRLKTTNLDMKNITEQAITEIFSRSLANAFQNSDEELTDEEMNQIYTEKMDDPAAQKVTMENDIKLMKDTNDRKWKVVVDTTFEDSITGNLISSFSGFAPDLQDNETSVDDPNVPGSRSNPVKMGETGTIDTVDYSEIKTGNFKVSMGITGTIRGDEAWKLIQNENMFNDPAPEGMEYILAKVAVSVTGADTEEVAFTISEYDFEFVSKKGNTYSGASVVTPDELQAELYKGGTTEGYVAGLIDKGDAVDLKYEGMDGSMWFSLD